jgi:hypothetical protein
MDDQRFNMSMRKFLKVVGVIMASTAHRAGNRLIGRDYTKVEAQRLLSARGGPHRRSYRGPPCTSVPCSVLVR